MPRPFELAAALFVAVALAACGSGQAGDNTTPAASTTRIDVVATPDATRVTPTPYPTAVVEGYTVRNGDTLSGISQRYDISVDDLMRLNSITDPKSLQVGQVLKVIVPVTRSGPSDSLLPDSEVVYGPAYASFDVAQVAGRYGGYLSGYQEKVDGAFLTGPQIVQLVAERFSVGPRVLLALVEYESGWLTKSNLTQNQISYPMGLYDSTRKGLFFQTSWAANHLNEGYYGKISGQLPAFKFKDNTRAHVGGSANPGTVAIQNVLSLNSDWNDWQSAIGPGGLVATYRTLFGDPGAFAIEPLIPHDLKQPSLRVPWNDGELWYYTGGPHSGWGDYSAWAAIDVTPTDAAGSGTCLASRMWAVAAAPGTALKSEHGRVVESLSGTGFQGSGWALLYMHMANGGRVAAGTQVKTGEPIGHPSCEGGDAQASHLHFARLYNGQWMDTDRVPMVISGWTVAALDQQYEGTITRGDQTRTACNCRDDAKNGITGDSGAAGR